MTALRTLATAILVSALVPGLSSLPACAQASGPSSQGDRQVTAPERRQLIDSLVREVDERYVLPDTARKVAASLRAQQQRGAYDGISSARQLSEVLTQALQATSGDRHLRVRYSEAPIPARKPTAAPSADEAARRLAMLRSDNFGVAKIEHLPFNIGYLELTGFAPAQQAAQTLAAAMTVLAHTDALIIDLRNNGGGDAAASTLLASYLFDRRTHLSDFHYREGGRTEQRWSLDIVPGAHYGQNKDVFILTSRDSFSAAEDFAYALKHLKRATVVGETTGGGANAGDDIRLLPHFAAFIPLSRLSNPVTKSNWEGVGVTPDVGVCAGDALRTAQLAILEKLARLEQDPSRLDHLKRRIAELERAKTAMATCL